MPLVDDLFAFGDDYAEPQPEKKKKKKKKKVKHIKEDGVPVIKKQKESSISDPFIISFDKNDKDADAGDISIVEKTEGVKEEAALTSLLGLSATTPTSSPSKPKSTNSALNNITDSEEDFSFMDRESRMSKVQEQPTVTDIDNKPDEFLTSINSYVSEMKEKDSELQELLQSYQQDDINIGGKSYPPKSVKFEFHIDIQAAGQISGSYDLQVKGSTKISKIVNSLMPLFNNDANPQFPQEEWNSLVLYVKDLNIILTSSLKCMSLLGYRNHLKRSNTAQFEVFGIITTEDNAKLLHSNESARRSQEDAAKAEMEKPTIAKGAEDEDEYAFINITIEDPQKTELETTSRIIDLDADVDDKTNKSEQVSSLVLSVIQSMTVSELASMYKYKSSLPSELKTELKKDGTILDPTKTLKELNFESKQSLTISYNPEELAELRIEQANNADDDDDDIDDDIDEIRPENDFGNENNDEQTQYFSIFVAGKDKKRFKVSVKPSTKISDISNFYLEKAGLPLSTKIKLVFDDDDLDMNGIVGDTELEDEFMVDVVLK